MPRRFRTFSTVARVGCALAAATIATTSRAADWPTYRRDTRRRAVSPESLHFPLKKQWTWQSSVRPRPAWTGPAKWDAYSGNRGLQSMRNIDPVFHVVLQGDRVYFGSSADHAVHCLDASSGAERWRCYAEGPIRFPPTVADGKAFFGSDDGHVYCAEATTGAVVWSFTPAPEARRIAHNGLPISLFPVRTGVLVDQGTAYAAASLLPWETSYLIALDTATGKPEGQGRYVRELPGVTLQGAMLASDEDLYVPQGRSAPLVFSREDGKPMGPVQGAGGVFCILDDSGHLLSGPPNQKGREDLLRVSSAKNRTSMAAVPGASCMVVTEDCAYLARKHALVALDFKRFVPLQARKEALTAQRKKQQKRGDKAGVAATDQELTKIAAELPSCTRWQRPCGTVFAMAAAGESLLIGKDGSAEALSMGDGSARWQATVPGKVHGLAAANGRLVLSTDAGAIVCFAP
ncbi:MAG: PQQ-binding-like beta-propeller repeat protein [Lentisphaerae bacterium]|jgi:outer membrane protein assembly factor BamB|nr:PQQ-binding-like beta-propeller repeat protein [Lentisphaerota bacterium]MBT5608597.1 PQQ-binding-like beta-propeller repeat protein [Lentisphaerota bacterium]MBT7054944.1 PQQ-binding-like beta-propeller repeat protein [Lentisphaerota bacterium]MBT7842791.1 PQQ-binding-like beta-propeller repeat protein [Lentisphaerota bacterium]